MPEETAVPARTPSQPSTSDSVTAPDPEPQPAGPSSPAEAETEPTVTSDHFAPQLVAASVMLTTGTENEAEKLAGEFWVKLGVIEVANSEIIMGDPTLCAALTYDDWGAAEHLASWPLALQLTHTEAEDDIGWPAGVVKVEIRNGSYQVLGRLVRNWDYDWKAV